jgi:hypothetical protein
VGEGKEQLVFVLRGRVHLISPSILLLSFANMSISSAISSRHFQMATSEEIAWQARYIESEGQSRASQSEKSMVP